MEIKVTVLMSVYNGERYLRETIESILNQTFKDFEFLIINDGSTDSTREIISSYNDYRIRLINNEVNIGLTKSLNKGIGVAKGKYIARMDADDISLSARLQKQVEFLDEHFTVGLVGTSVVQIDEEGRTVVEIPLLTESAKIQEELLFGNQFCHGSIMFRKECVERAGKYREEFKYAQDYDLYLRMAEYYELSNLNDFLYKWRLVVSSISVSRKLKQDRYAMLARKCAKERKVGKEKIIFSNQQLAVDDEGESSFRGKQWALAYYYYNWGRALCGQNRIKEARGLINKAIKFAPFYLEVRIFYFATYLPFFLLKRIHSLWMKCKSCWMFVVI